ncbi:hypothetical protein ACVOMV_08285 [Mesorhizobium atlanticum]
MRPHPKPQPFPLDTLTVNRASPEHLSRQLYHGLVAIIRSRALPLARSSSTRALAAELGLGRNTIVAAYDQLVTEGYLANRQGARPVIVDLPEGPRESPREDPPAPLRSPCCAASSCSASPIITVVQACRLPPRHAGRGKLPLRRLGPAGGAPRQPWR